VIERLRRTPAASVADTREAQHLDSHLTSDDGLGTVDIPTASAPMARKYRISAGVS
jgi:hypothetical protein